MIDKLETNEAHLAGVKILTHKLNEVIDLVNYMADDQQEIYRRLLEIIERQEQKE